uniref:Uncharacterized protein n=1 Tax=Rangifer tarandus platyrhynchus TaxID=3082113 RepID=A0ACB0EX40_RANTA|nr:unnamed protein product [Rangifer tarandus platyrhynchus]
MGQVQRKADRGRGPIWAGPTASWTLGHQSQAPRKWPCLRWPLGALSLTLIGTPGPQGAGAGVDRGLEAVLAPDGAGGLQGEEGTPSDGGGTQGLTASVLHVHSFPEPSPGVEPSAVAQEPWSDQ